MTAYSLRILEFPTGASSVELESSTLKADVAQALSRYADECGPYGLQSWAEARGHKLYYVDNCWVRARVRGRDIAAFLAERLKSPPALGRNIQADGEYLIEAEEY